jgi:hypothetical protein
MNGRAQGEFFVFRAQIRPCIESCTIFRRTMPEDLMAQFNLAMFRILEKAAALVPPLGFPGFRTMLVQHGGKRTADILLDRAGVSDGFTRLVLHSLETGQKDALQLAVEYLVLQQPWRQLFTPAQREIARRRLREVACEPPPEDLEPLRLEGSGPEDASPIRSELPVPHTRPPKRIRDLPPPTRRHALYEKVVEAEGWTPLIVCDHAGCYWNLSTVRTSDERTLSGISKGAPEHLIAMLQAGHFGEEASNAFVDHRHWDRINDNLNTWPNADVIAREGLRALALESLTKRDVSSRGISPLTQNRRNNLDPTTGPKPASWTGTVSRDASLQSFAYVFQFGNREVWKIGHALDVNHRLAEVNKHVPYEILGEQWCVCLQHGLPHDSEG